MSVGSVAKRSVLKLMDEGKHRAAVKSATDYADWAREFHDIDQLAAEVDALKTGTDSGRTSR
jgi:hypothetical protein